MSFRSVFIAVVIGFALNDDGTIGTCTACHTRHTASVAIARRPTTCRQCHIGPDHSQLEIYEESKHGVMFSAQERLLRLDAPPRSLTARDMFVPTCATTRRFLMLCAVVLGVQALVGLAGFGLHLRAVFRQPGPTFFERLLTGAPPMAPLLFPNLVVLALIGLWALDRRLPGPVAHRPVPQSAFHRT